MEPSWRKPMGILGLLVYLALYAGGVGALGEWLGRLPTIVEIVLYLLLGVAWLLPLGPLLRWMNGGGEKRP